MKNIISCAQIIQKRGGVCTWYKDHLPIIKKDVLGNLKESLVTEIKTGWKKCFFLSMYRSTSQTLKKFENFCTSNVNPLMHNTSKCSDIL